MTAIIARITDYLVNGGLVNPEMMEHNKVRDLLIDCRDTLDHYEQHEQKNKRPFSDRHAQKVIEGQVKEIERLQKLLAEARK